MGELVPRKRSSLSRSQRVDRGFRLSVAAGVSGVAFAVTLLLALVGAIGGAAPALTALATAAFGYGAYRTIRP